MEQDEQNKAEARHRGCREDAPNLVDETSWTWRILEPYLELSIAGTCWSTIRPPDGQTDDLLFPGPSCLLI